MSKTFYITTPIYYPSGRYHIGTAYTEVLCDALKRYHKMHNDDVFMLTGSDEHGQKIQDKAAELGRTPKEHVDIIAEEAKKLWSMMDINYDKYIRTTDDYHEKVVQDIFERFLEQGDIYLGEYEGWYCKPCESYWTESQLVDGMCPDCGREVKKMKEEAYFFNMKKYADRLLNYYDEHPNFIKPDYRKTEMINNFIKPGLEDLCVTRTSFDWGIKVKSNPKHVIYVWLDALTNYITALGYNQENHELFDKYWPANIHVVGKDIARFHLIYWPIFLMALDLPLPETVYVHNFIVMKDGKMSKSKGNTIYPEQLIEKYGLDATKYYLLREMPTNGDEVFTPEDFVNRYNYDLCNDLGNLLNRTVSMINKYFDGIIPDYKGQINEVDKDLEESIDKAVQENARLISEFEFANAIQAIWDLIGRTNKYVDETAPWNLAKEEDKTKLESAMNHLAGSLKVIAILIRPFLKGTSGKILTQLGLETEVTFDDINNYNKFDNVKVIEKGEPIFLRLDSEKEIEEIKELMKNH